MKRRAGGGDEIEDGDGAGLMEDDEEDDEDDVDDADNDDDEKDEEEEEEKEEEEEEEEEETEDGGDSSNRMVQVRVSVLPSSNEGSTGRTSVEVISINIFIIIIFLIILLLSIFFIFSTNYDILKDSKKLLKFQKFIIQVEL